MLLELMVNCWAYNYEVLNPYLESQELAMCY